MLKLQSKIFCTFILLLIILEFWGILWISSGTIHAISTVLEVKKIYIFYENLPKNHYL